MQNEQFNRKALEDLEKRHLEELYNYDREIRSKLNTLQKSKDILNLEYQIEKLVKKQRYKEAALMKKKLNKIMDTCIEKNRRRAETKLKNLMENLMKKQDAD